MSEVQILDSQGRPFKASAYEGAGNGMDGQLRGWNTRPMMADAAILPSLDLGNGRAEDLVRNNAFASNAVQLHVDNIVGHLFRLSYKPRWQRLGINEQDAIAFSRDVEQIWTEISDDPSCWLDVERKRTFTMMIREGVATHTRLGEVMAVPFYERSNSPLNTGIKVINPNRVSSPSGMDTDRIRGGVEQNRHGAAIAYHVKNTSSLLYGDGMDFSWQRIPKFTRHGRLRFIHVFEPTGDGQSRGANQFLSVLEQMQMLPKMQKTKLQNAIVNAMFAATIETEMGSEDAFALLGGDTDSKMLGAMLGKIADYHSGVNLKLGGTRIPHLLPNESLNFHSSGNVDNGYVDLESSVLRWLSAGLNVPYEQLARDYKQSSYSSARASILEGWRYFMGRRKVIAARLATQIFRLVFEELVARGEVKLPRGARMDIYQGMAAWTNCEWIGTGRLAIDGLKEVKEAVLRIESGLSTYEKELALMGEDYQEIFAQQLREQKERAEAGLPKPSWIQADSFAPENIPQEAA